MKLTEVCDLVATLCVCESELTGSETHKKVTDIEAVTIDGNLIVENYKLNIDDAINSFVKKYFHCDGYFFTRQKSSVVCRYSRNGSVTKVTVSADLHTVTRL